MQKLNPLFKRIFVPQQFAVQHIALNIYPLRYFSNSSNDNPPYDRFYSSQGKTEDFITADEQSNFHERNFADKRKVKVIGGKGGNGCISFYRDRVVRSGAPEGGDGGKGGDFYFRASRRLQDLRVIKRLEFKGNDGKNGRAGNMMGKDGADIYYNVPIGTLVWQLRTKKKKINLKDEKGNLVEQVVPVEIGKKLIADLDVEGKAVLVAKGGAAGRGNGLHPGITQIEYGKPGEVVDVLLELKSLADIGFVGFPNAGKSTLLACLTRAFPKIAPYPFTTLSPTVGKIRFLDDFEMTLADIPGLIEGSYENKGLGHDFLRHIERTSVLVYILDATDEDLVGTYRILQKELENYPSGSLATKRSIVVCNKIDIEENWEFKVKFLSNSIGHEVIAISGKHSIGLEKLVTKLRELVLAEKAEQAKKNQEMEERSY